MDERLARLAQLKGIVLAYDDVWGARHVASPATLVSLLRSMGVDATDSVRVDAAIAAIEEERWSRMLPPVLVLVFVAIMVFESEYTHLIRVLFFAPTT